MDCVILASSGKFDKPAINPGVRQNSEQADPVKMAPVYLQFADIKYLAV